jgi:hypothetical protein
VSVVSHPYCLVIQVYANVSGEAPLDEPMIDVSSSQFYGEGYDDSDKRIPDMTIINKQLGIAVFLNDLLCRFAISPHYVLMAKR